MPRPLTRPVFARRGGPSARRQPWRGPPATRPPREEYRHQCGWTAPRSGRHGQVAHGTAAAGARAW